MLTHEIDPPQLLHTSCIDHRSLGETAMDVEPNDPHVLLLLFLFALSRSRRGNTTTTDPRSQRNRVGRRGGQLLTRARSPSYARPAHLPCSGNPLSRLLPKLRRRR